MFLRKVQLFYGTVLHFYRTTLHLHAKYAIFYGTSTIFYGRRMSLMGHRRFKSQNHAAPRLPSEPTIYFVFSYYTRLKIITCSRLLKTGCNNVVLPTLFIVVNNTVQHCHKVSRGSTSDNYAYLWLSQCAKERPSPPRHK